VKPRLIALAALLAGGGAACLAETSVSNRIDAGLWEVTATASFSDTPGAPQPPITGRRCLTSEEAAKGPEAMLIDGQPDCSVTRSAMVDGKLDALLQCAAGTGQAKTIAIKASFAAKRYEAASTITFAKGGATTTVNVTGKWVGACSS
jgi:hypothetical protein